MNRRDFIKSLVLGGVTLAAGKLPALPQAMGGLASTRVPVLPSVPVHISQELLDDTVIDVESFIARDLARVIAEQEDKIFLGRST